MLFRQGFDKNKENHKQQNKLRRLWRPAVATHPQMQANGIIADWGMLCEVAGLWRLAVATHQRTVKHLLRVAMQILYKE